ncbi:MAG: SecY-interacting protein [Plesiomonas sp.]|uniref:SecY-interacting protein n=1 Tax=Plesiomonas sp. TaxID=2486279 RepID=UPI003F38463E
MPLPNTPNMSQDNASASAPQSAQALIHFTDRYLQHWQTEQQTLPESESLLGIASPCIARTAENSLYWQPVRPGIHSENPVLQPVEQALNIQLRAEAHAYFSVQFAGDMAAQWQGNPLTLLQIWSHDDFPRMLENQIGHLVTQRRLKQSPTLFLALTDDDMQIISLCNITGEILLETLGTAQRTRLADNLPDFLAGLTPHIAVL